MLKIKTGVILGCAPAGVRIIEALKTVSKTLGMDLTITSGADGVHSGPKDPHYSYQAYDIRTHDLTEVVKRQLLALLLQELGPKFSGFIESAGTPNEHLHVQRLYGTIYTMTDFVSA